MQKRKQWKNATEGDGVGAGYRAKKQILATLRYIVAIRTMPGSKCGIPKAETIATWASRRCRWGHKVGVGAQCYDNHALAASQSTKFRSTKKMLGGDITTLTLGTATSWQTSCPLGMQQLPEHR